MERYLLETYCKALASGSKKEERLVPNTAMLFAVSQCASYLINACTIWYGALLIRKGHLDVYGFFACFVAVTFGARDAGDSFLYAPESAGAIAVARKIKHLLVESEDKGMVRERENCSRTSSKDRPRSRLPD